MLPLMISAVPGTRSLTHPRHLRQRPCPSIAIVPRFNLPCPTVLRSTLPTTRIFSNPFPFLLPFRHQRLSPSGCSNAAALFTLPSAVPVVLRPPPPPAPSSTQPNHQPCIRHWCRRTLWPVITAYAPPPDVLLQLDLVRWHPQQYQAFPSLRRAHVQLPPR